MQLRNASRLLSVSVLSLGGVVYSSSVFAAGFALRDHSASGVGTALASDAVNTFDASGVLSNPAIMSQFKGNHLSLDINYTDANIKASNSTLALYTGAVHPVQGEPSEDNVSDPVTVPSLYGIFQINDDAHVGISFNVPYGTNTEYSNSWTGRYYGTKTDLKTYDIGLHFSYKFTPMFAAGVTLDWQKAKGQLTSAVDTALLTAGALGQAAAGAAASADPAVRARAAAYAAAAVGAQANIGKADSLTTYSGDSTQLAWGLGFLFTPDTTIRVGLSYRGEVKHKAKGDLKWGPENDLATAYLGTLRASGNRQVQNSDDARLDINLPSVTSLGYAQDLSDFTVYGNLTYTNWSTLSELTPKWNGAQSKTDLNWKNSLYVAIGGDYRLAPEWTLRAGVGHDQGVTDEKHRTPRTPDGDRTALSLGASYKVGTLDFSLGVQQLFLPTTHSDLEASAYPDNQARGTFKTTYKINPTIAVVSAGYGF
ncbi:MAG: outer membrane protein transport protein [Chitinophagaceae bacterium]|nr:outer membrane protein transport protein [Oligoflexus sp.]